MDLVYVVSQWRAPTQTFVRREVEAARAAGNTATVLSLKRPPTADPGDPPVVYLGAGAVPAFLGVASRHPVRTARVLGRAAIRSQPRTIAANMAAVALGVAADRRLPPGWVHAHFAWAAAGAADGLAAVRGGRYSVFPHAFDIFDERFVDRYTADKLRRAAVVVVESEEIRDEVTRRFGCPCEVARMGIAETQLLDVAARRPQPGLVVSVGSLLPKKGHDVLVRAIARLPDVHLRIVGDGPERGPLIDLAARLGVAERVQLVGWVQEDGVVAELDRASVFCLASRTTASGDRDGVPNVLIEAMGRAVPCVSTTVSGIPSLLGDGRGILVAPDDPAALAAALRGALSEDGPAIGRRGRDHVADRYLTGANWSLLEEHIRIASDGFPDIVPGADDVKAYYRQNADAIDADRQHSPHWTRRWVHQRIFDRFLDEVAPGETVVDVGCGDGSLAAALVAHGARVIATDLSIDNVRAAQRVLGPGQPGRVVVSDAEHLPFRPTVHTVVSSHVVEHLPDPVAGLRELGRIAAGRLLVAMPTCANPVAVVVVGGDAYWRVTRRTPFAWALGLARIAGAAARGDDGPDEGYRGHRHLPHVWRFPRRLRSLVARSGLQIDAVVAGPLALPYLGEYLPRLRPLLDRLDTHRARPVLRWMGVGTHLALSARCEDVEPGRLRADNT